MTADDDQRALDAALDTGFAAAPDKLTAQLLGMAYMLHVPHGASFREPSWLANIEAAFLGCMRERSLQSYQDYLFMLAHWFAPMAEEYMEHLEERDPDVTDRILVVLTSVYQVMAHDHHHPALRAARHAAKRLSHGAKERAFL